MLQITIFDTKIEYFLPRKNLPIWDPNLPIWKPKSPYLSPRKYHMYVIILKFEHCVSTIRALSPKDADSVDPDQTAHSLIWVYSVCSDLSVRKLRNIMVNVPSFCVFSYAETNIQLRVKQTINVETLFMSNLFYFFLYMK